MNALIRAAEHRVFPDVLVRAGIRGLLRKRLRAESGRAAGSDPYSRFAREVMTGPVALAVAEANEQHYEVPAKFFELVLGPQLKYSCALYEEGTSDLARAEEAMLALTSARAQLQDGQRVLELGCGWGSLTLSMAKHFPNSKITGVSNSTSQREFIIDRAQKRGLANIEIITCDINTFAIDQQFDRVVSVEMFEHVRNWQSLLNRIHPWLAADGKLFLHFFAHRQFPYVFQASGDDDWMGRHFFTGGIMPSADLLGRLAIPFHLEQDWWVDGGHYAQTATAWLRNLDRHEGEVEQTFAKHPSRSEARLRVQRWRIFFLACAELFGYRNGQEWGVVHARLTPKMQGPLQ